MLRYKEPTQTCQGILNQNAIQIIDKNSLKASAMMSQGKYMSKTSIINTNKCFIPNEATGLLNMSKDSCMMVSQNIENGDNMSSYQLNHNYPMHLAIDLPLNDIENIKKEYDLDPGLGIFTAGCSKSIYDADTPDMIKTGGDILD